MDSKQANQLILEETLPKTFELHFEVQLHTDLVFICSNNIQVSAHQAVLAAVSEFLKDVFLSNKQDKVFICLPDIDSQNMKILINFLYEGVAQVNIDELASIKEILNLLNITIPNTDICMLEDTNTACEYPAEMSVGAEIISGPMYCNSTDPSTQVFIQEGLVSGFQENCQDTGYLENNVREPGCEGMVIKQETDAVSEVGKTGSSAIEIIYLDDANTKCDETKLQNLKNEPDVSILSGRGSSARELRRSSLIKYSQSKKFTRSQERALEKCYQKYKFPSTCIMSQIAGKLKLPLADVNQWFNVRDFKARGYEEVHPCTYSGCKQIYGSLQNLQEHIQRHFPSKSFGSLDSAVRKRGYSNATSSNTCNTAAATASQISMHKNVCSICQIEFPCEQKLFNHMANHNKALLCRALASASISSNFATDKVARKQ